MSNPPTVPELDNLATHDLDQWKKLMLTGGARLPFGSSASYSSHPLREYFEKQRIGKTDKLMYTEMMEICAENKGLIDSVPFDSEMVTVKEQVVELIFFNLNPPIVKADSKISLEQYMHDTLKWASDALEGAMLDISELVACGVPLYRLGLDRSLDCRVSDNEQPSAFLIGKWMYGEENHWTHQLPVWAAGHGFRKSDVKIARLFFTGDAKALTPEQFSVLKAAYRSQIGYSRDLVEERASNGSAGFSKLLSVVKEVQDRYYGTNFSIADQQTWTKQKDVVEWLKQTKGLSGREAEAIDLVARPDIARGKA